MSDQDQTRVLNADQTVDLSAARPTTGASRVGGVGTQIGPYTILDRLGEGGFGYVYVADQHEPIKRRVALKVLKPGMDSEAILTRFEAERQALAVMDHPNIARVYDAGQTKYGSPFFVMELVNGVPITDYCDKQQLTIRQRVELFIQVCSAIQHAHQKGIIHRDLKPSNILVASIDDKPLLKVIDFGIAKATAVQLTDKTFVTEQGQMLGTPEYMSPEQASMTGSDIDTRTDVYALGVVLYQLVTGVLPFESQTLRSAGMIEIQRIIKEVDPPRPSTRCGTLGDQAMTISHARRLEPKQIRRQIAGDLDWITLRCLEKERDRRYETVNALAMELKRYLNNEPVLAGPPSASYKLKKMVRRHRGPVAAGATIFALLLVSSIISTTLYVYAERQRRIADDNALQAKLTAERMKQDYDELMKLRENRTETASTETEQTVTPTDVEGTVAKVVTGNILLHMTPDGSASQETYPVVVPPNLSAALRERYGDSFPEAFESKTIRVHGDLYQRGDSKYLLVKDPGDLELTE